MFLITVSSSGVSDTSNQNQVTHSQVHVLPLNHLFSTLPTLRCRMEDMCLILSLFTLGGSFHKGLAVLIQTQQTVLAAVGEDAPLSCRLLETKDVQQVTWQKVLEKTERNIGSYSQYFGETVNPGFKDKVQFTEAGLQKNSIVIRNVTEQDAGCYLCLFNTYPDGALIAATCLEVYELHGPFIDVSRSNSPPGSDVTCSATGRPVPMVTLTVLHQNLSFSHYNTSTETNTNGTVTVTTKVLLSDLSSTQVGCSVSVDSAAPRELLVTVPEVKDSSDDGLNNQSDSDFRGFRWPLIVVFLIVLICICVLQFRRISQNRNLKASENATDNQNLDNPPVSTKDVRLRTPERQKQNSESNSSQ
ncbi:OX-2 membrane glycoprotein-like isoform X2 [Xiphophorus couchianus]|uniref:OX-2 membrane glycoprotein-like isoform X2 n=1 Tax=Xiphophorus couchianus TaxID=32473 RepID=UPI0010165BF5|nr:OX-2 membrane glycoprotein-like isoform X2 [Xiphophorus couchianus]